MKIRVIESTKIGYVMPKEEAINYIKTLKYDQKLLDEKRKKFYNSFIMKD